MEAVEQSVATTVAGLRPDEQALVANADLARRLRGFPDAPPDIGAERPGF